jgi:hypothetical protein
VQKTEQEPRTQGLVEECIGKAEELLAREVALVAELASAGQPTDHACEMLTELEEHAARVLSLRDQLLSQEQ